MNHLKKIKEILNGWYNDLIDTPKIQELALERAKHCANCLLNVNNTCTGKLEAPAVKDFTYEVNNEKRYKNTLYSGCGCPLSKKLKSENTQCPIGKW